HDPIVASYSPTPALPSFPTRRSSDLHDLRQREDAEPRVEPLQRRGLVPALADGVAEDAGDRDAEDGPGSQPPAPAGSRILLRPAEPDDGHETEPGDGEGVVADEFCQVVADEFCQHGLPPCAAPIAC